MQEHMKKPPTKRYNNLNIQIDEDQFNFEGIPNSKIKLLFSFLGELKEYKSEISSWRDSSCVRTIFEETGGESAFQKGAISLNGPER